MLPVVRSLACSSCRAHCCWSQGCRIFYVVLFQTFYFILECSRLTMCGRFRYSAIRTCIHSPRPMRGELMWFLNVFLWPQCLTLQRVLKPFGFSYVHRVLAFSNYPEYQSTFQKCVSTWSISYKITVTANPVSFGIFGTR